MPDERDNEPVTTPNDVLEDVAAWLERFVSFTPSTGADPQRLCRDAGDWIRSVRREMHDLREQFVSGADARVAAENLAAAVSRLTDGVEGLSKHARGVLRSNGQSVEGPRPAHVEGANEIRESVAELRRRLREERAQRAREAAEQRRQFIESLRGHATAADVQTKAPPTEAPEEPEPLHAEAPAPVDDGVTPEMTEAAASPASNKPSTLPTNAIAPQEQPTEEPIAAGNVPDLTPEPADDWVIADRTASDADECTTSQVSDPAEAPAATEPISDVAPPASPGGAFRRVDTPPPPSTTTQTPPVLGDREPDSTDKAPSIRFRRVG